MGPGEPAHPCDARRQTDRHTHAHPPFSSSLTSPPSSSSLSLHLNLISSRGQIAKLIWSRSITASFDGCGDQPVLAKALKKRLCGIWKVYQSVPRPLFSLSRQPICVTIFAPGPVHLREPCWKSAAGKWSSPPPHPPIQDTHSADPERQQHLMAAASSSVLIITCLVFLVWTRGSVNQLLFVRR